MDFLAPVTKEDLGNALLPQSRIAILKEVNTLLDLLLFLMVVSVLAAKEVPGLALQLKSITVLLMEGHILLVHSHTTT